MDFIWDLKGDFTQLLSIVPWESWARCCSAILDNPTLRATLEDAKFDLAIVDTGSNECGLALANALGLPVIGCWGFPSASLEFMFTAASMPPSHVPAFTGMGHEMTFPERVLNFLSHSLMRVVMLYHFWVTDGLIRSFIPNSPSCAEVK